MDNTDRTCSTPFEIPDDVLRLLRHAADLGLEKACDFGDYDDDVRARVLNAARAVDLFYLGTPNARQVAEMADNALMWQEPPKNMPTRIDALTVYFSQLGKLRALIKVRDQALAKIGVCDDEMPEPSE